MWLKLRCRAVAPAVLVGCLAAAGVAAEAGVFQAVAIDPAVGGRVDTGPPAAGPPASGVPFTDGVEAGIGGVEVVDAAAVVAVDVVVAGSCGWVAPVDAPVVDPFRAPAHRYGPGNRGLEFGVGDGAPVVAVADGRVGFVGSVAGRLYVVIGHDGGIRSTYGPLSRALVVSGQTVGAATEVGQARRGFHLTARIGDRYVDPQPFLDGRCGRARLVAPHQVR